MKFTVTSLFSGLGGLDLGFSWEDFEVIWANDISAAATRTYFENFGFAAVCAPLEDVASNAIPDADVVIGGPPCQSFSLVGQRRPDDPRGKLVFEFVRVVREKRPRAFVMENVPGLAASTHNGVRLPLVLTSMFEELGYHVTRLDLVASDFMVPQRRKRLLLIGCLDGNVEPPVPSEFVATTFGASVTSLDISAKAAIGDLGKCVAKGERSRYSSPPDSLLSKLMRDRDPDSVSLHECPRMSATDQRLVAHIPPGGNYRDVPDEVATGRILKFKASGGRTTTYGRLHPDLPAYTINTYFRRPNVGCHFHYAEPRLITPREAMRFQSIPDWVEVFAGSQDARNSLIGNCVPPLLAQAVAASLDSALKGKVRQKAAPAQRELFKHG